MNVTASPTFNMTSVQDGQERVKKLNKDPAEIPARPIFTIIRSQEGNLYIRLWRPKRNTINAVMLTHMHTLHIALIIVRVVRVAIVVCIWEQSIAEHFDSF